MSDQPIPTYDCLVLSGGGAKGAYGAGVAKALFAYREKKNVDTRLCYIGASAGALNASILATGGRDGANRLIKLWQQMNNRAVLGHKHNLPKVWGAGRWVKQKITFDHEPFGVYSGHFLGTIISKSIKLADVKEHLIIAATDYTRGQLKAFCKFPGRDFDIMIRDDQSNAPVDQRLSYWRSVETDDVLRGALLASASIPVFFPPVRIDVTDLNGNSEVGWHIDGGIGNNTPTREAAYFLRRMAKNNLGKPGETYCVKLDSPRTIQEDQEDSKMYEIIARTLEVYHRVHTEPVIRAWSLINRDVRRQNERLDGFSSWLSKQPGLDASTRTRIEEELRQQLGPWRLDAELIEIEPGSPLGDSLEFDPAAIVANIKRGYAETLIALRHKNKIDSAEFDSLQRLPIFSDGA